MSTTAQRRFIPGATQNTAKLIHYVSEIQRLHPEDTRTCYCVPAKYDKNTPGSDAATSRVSRAIRISQLVTTARAGGGATQFGNFYLGQPLEINYLGRAAGMPGGSGKPPTN